MIIHSNTQEINVVNGVSLKTSYEEIYSFPLKSFTDANRTEMSTSVISLCGRPLKWKRHLRFQQQMIKTCASFYSHIIFQRFHSCVWPPLHLAVPKPEKYLLSRGRRTESVKQKRSVCEFSNFGKNNFVEFSETKIRRKFVENLTYALRMDSGITQTRIA